ncbi:MAG: bifunctional folylpolyglutamate synthase/dihydrofolate synthase, partial [Alphaproteobacteria bacterium]
MSPSRPGDDAVGAVLARLAARHPRRIDLGLERIVALLKRLGNPHHRVPPVIHVAGTNGKGSTVAFARACLEAAGHRVHVYTSPHLVRFHERIRLAGKLIDDARLIACLEQAEKAAADDPVT